MKMIKAGAFGIAKKIPLAHLFQNRGTAFHLVVMERKLFIDLKSIVTSI